MKDPKAWKLPSGRWRAEVVIGGVRHSFVRDTPEEASKAALIVKLQQSADAKDNQKANELLTLSEAIDEYISSRSKILSPSTIKGYKNIQKMRFQSVMDAPLSSKTNWQAIINREAKDSSAKTIKNAWGLVRSVLEENNISVGKIRLPRVEKQERLFFEPEQIKLFVDAVKGHKYEMPYLLCLHGLRRSEALAVKKSDIKNGYIHVHGAILIDKDNHLVAVNQGKTVASNRMVPIMIPRLQELIDKSKDELLCNACKHPNNLSNPLATLCRNNGLPEVGVHGLRHSYASLCYHLGLSELQAMEFGGWSDISVMRKIYTHLASSDRAKAEAQLKQFFMS